MRRRRFLASVTGAAAAGLTGCLEVVGGPDDDPWSQFQRGPGHSGFIEGVNVPRAGGRVRWRSDTWGVRTSPVLSGDTVYFGTGLRSKQVVAMDAMTGEQRWAAPVEGDVERALAVSDGSVLAAADRFYAIDAETGEERWTKDSEVIGRPTVSDGTLITSLDGDRTSAIDAETGEVQWTGDPETEGGLAMHDGTVVVSRPAELLALDAGTGETEWTTSSDDALRAPTVGNETIFAGSSGTLRAFDASSGENVWTLEGYFRSTDSAVAEGSLYLTGRRVGDDSRRLLAVDTASGEVEWTYDPELVTRGTVAVADETVYLAADNRLYALDARTGDPAFWLRFQWPIGPPAIGADSLFLSVGGRLHAIRSGDGRRGNWRVDEEPIVGTDASSTTPAYGGSDLYFGLDGYEVTSETDLTVPADAPVDASLRVEGDRIDRGEDVTVEFVVTNRSERTLTVSGMPPGPFGVWALQNEANSLTLWTDAYEENRHVHVRPGEMPTVNAIGRETAIPPGETVRETYALSDETHGIRPGTYEFSRGFQLRPEDSTDESETWRVEPRVTVDLSPAGPEDGDVAFDLVVADQVTLPESFTGELAVDVLEPMTESHPGLIEVTFHNPADDAMTFVRTVRDLPFGAVVGIGAGRRRLVLIEEDLFAPGLVERTSDGWWRTNFLPHEWILYGGRTRPVGPGDAVAKRFVVATHPETDTPTPGDGFVFEQGFDDGDTAATWVFSLSPREPV